MPVINTNAFCFDSYNYNLCCHQHRTAIRCLVLDISAQALGLHAGAWSSRQTAERSDCVSEIDDQSCLPACFGNKKRKLASRRGSDTSSGETQFVHANRRRVCACVPRAGLQWWMPGVGPCGRRGQQCGCVRRRVPEEGELWECWRPDQEAWTAAVVVSAARLWPETPKMSKVDGGETEEAMAAVAHPVVDLLFIADGCLATAWCTWLRPPTVPVALSDLETLDMAPCICSLFAAHEEAQLIHTSAIENNSADTASDKPSPVPYSWMHAKHWNQRYRYFSRYDEGVQIDHEGWYSICPEACAEHVAKRIAGAGLKVVFDAFSGCGGNALALAKHCDFVASCDIDAVKVACARHNAEVYGVSHKIDFFVGDSSEFLKSLSRRKKAGQNSKNGLSVGKSYIFDAVCLAPPWGGPDYLASPVFDLETMLCCPLNGRGWLQAAQAASEHVVLVVPRTVRPKQFSEICGTPNMNEVCEIVEVEDVALNYKVKLKVGYYGPQFAAQRQHQQNNLREVNGTADLDL